MLFGCCVEQEWLPWVRRCGFDYAELRVGTVRPMASDDEWRGVREELLRHNVPILGFNVLLPGEFRVVGPDVDWGQLTTYVERAFVRMGALCGRYLSFGSGGARRVPDGWDRGVAEAQLERFIGLLAEAGSANGVTVNVEFLNRKETNIINSLLEALPYVKAANHANIRMLADLYHMMEESEPLEDLRAVADAVGYVHVADTGRRYPGSGSYPYIRFAEVLREIGYDGPVSVECNWGTDVKLEMERSAAYLRQQFGREDV